MELAGYFFAGVELGVIGDGSDRKPRVEWVYRLDDGLGWDRERARRTCVMLLGPYREKGRELLGGMGG